MFRSTQSRSIAGDEEASVNLAPLIDMIFILLIFFLVTAQFIQETSIPVTPPEAVSGEPLPVAPLRVAIASQGELMLEGRLIDLPAMEQALRAYVRQRPAGALVIVPDARAAAGRLVQVMDAARLAGIESIQVLTREPAGGGRR